MGIISCLRPCARRSVKANGDGDSGSSSPTFPPPVMESCISETLTNTGPVQVLSADTKPWRVASPQDQPLLSQLSPGCLTPLTWLGEGAYGCVELCRVSVAVPTNSMSGATTPTAAVMETPKGPQELISHKDSLHCSPPAHTARCARSCSSSISAAPAPAAASPAAPEMVVVRPGRFTVSRLRLSPREPSLSPRTHIRPCSGGSSTTLQQHPQHPPSRLCPLASYGTSPAGSPHRAPANTGVPLANIAAADGPDAAAADGGGGGPPDCGSPTLSTITHKQRNPSLLRSSIANITTTAAAVVSAAAAVAFRPRSVGSCPAQQPSPLSSPVCTPAIVVPHSSPLRSYPSAGCCFPVSATATPTRASAPTTPTAATATAIPTAPPAPSPTSSLTVSNELVVAVKRIEYKGNGRYAGGAGAAAGGGGGFKGGSSKHRRPSRNRLNRMQAIELLQLARCRECPFIVRVFGCVAEEPGSTGPAASTPVEAAAQSKVPGTHSAAAAAETGKAVMEGVGAGPGVGSRARPTSKGSGGLSCRIVMEWAEGGDLGSLVKTLAARRGPAPGKSSRERLLMSESSARFYLACLLEALAFLHGKGLIHRDVKPANLLLSSRGVAKLGDLGMVCHLDRQGYAVGRAGTPNYMAPEVWAYGSSSKYSGYGANADLWSAGVVLYELLTGHLPASHPDEYLHASWRFTPHHAAFSPPLRDLLSRLLVAKPRRRLQSVADVVAHPWFAGFDWEGLRDGTLTPPYIPAAHRPYGTQPSAVPARSLMAGAGSGGSVEMFGSRGAGGGGGGSGAGGGRGGSISVEGGPGAVTLDSFPVVLPPPLPTSELMLVSSTSPLSRHPTAGSFRSYDRHRSATLSYTPSQTLPGAGSRSPCPRYMGPRSPSCPESPARHFAVAAAGASSSASFAIPSPRPPPPIPPASSFSPPQHQPPSNSTRLRSAPSGICASAPAAPWSSKGIPHPAISMAAADGCYPHGGLPSWLLPPTVASSSPCCCSVSSSIASLPSLYNCPSLGATTSGAVTAASCPDRQLPSPTPTCSDPAASTSAISSGFCLFGAALASVLAPGGRGQAAATTTTGVEGGGVSIGPSRSPSGFCHHHNARYQHDSTVDSSDARDGCSSGGGALTISRRSSMNTPGMYDIDDGVGRSDGGGVDDVAPGDYASGGGGGGQLRRSRRQRSFLAPTAAAAASQADQEVVSTAIQASVASPYSLLGFLRSSFDGLLQTQSHDPMTTLSSGSPSRPLTARGIVTYGLDEQATADVYEPYLTSSCGLSITTEYGKPYVRHRASMASAASRILGSLAFCPTPSSSLSSPLEAARWPDVILGPLLIALQLQAQELGAVGRRAGSWASQRLAAAASAAVALPDRLQAKALAVATGLGAGGATHNKRMCGSPTTVSDAKTSAPMMAGECDGPVVQPPAGAAPPPPQLLSPASAAQAASVTSAATNPELAPMPSLSNVDIQLLAPATALVLVRRADGDSTVGGADVLGPVDNPTRQTSSPGGAVGIVGGSSPFALPSAAAAVAIDVASAAISSSDAASSSQLAATHNVESPPCHQRTISFCFDAFDAGGLCRTEGPPSSGRCISPPLSGGGSDPLAAPTCPNSAARLGSRTFSFDVHDVCAPPFLAAGTPALMPRRGSSRWGDRATGAHNAALWGTGGDGDTAAAAFGATAAGHARMESISECSGLVPGFPPRLAALGLRPITPRDTARPGSPEGRRQQSTSTVDPAASAAAAGGMRARVAARYSDESARSWGSVGSCRASQVWISQQWRGEALLVTYSACLVVVVLVWALLRTGVERRPH